MARAAIDALSRHHGIATAYEDPDGGTRPVPRATRRLILEEIGVDPAGPPRGRAAARRIAVPETAACFLPSWLEAAPAWGIFCQLYELRSPRNWGIGDFADLAEMARIAAGAGADFLGVNPLHALFLARPDRCSPFSPSNRRFLNPLYLSMDDLPGGAAADPDLLATLRTADHVDYARVGAAKHAALAGVFARTPFDKDRYRRDAFDAFVEAGGTALRRHALFEALSLALVARGHGEGWRAWPRRFRDVEGPAVAAFARANDEAVAFHMWLQWIADRQLAAAARAARDAGMRIGLYLDLAVGEAPDGSATWSAPELTMSRLTIGAPPDVFAVAGQNWGLSAPSPRALAERDFAPFRAMIGAQLRHAGALRIDHAMALWQLFLIPEGRDPAAGAHLRYPFAGLIRALAEESQRNGALVIGEDLGFVPPGFRAAMAKANVLSYRILYFEQTARGFRRIQAWPALALACLSTHDLPTLARWWQGEDMALRRAHGLMEAEGAAEQDRHRAGERRALVAALAGEGLLRHGEVDPDAAEMPSGVLAAAHRYIARTPSRLVGVRLSDLVGPAAPTNLPGTVDAYPNWRPRSPTELGRIAAAPAFAAVTGALRDERPRPR